METALGLTELTPVGLTELTPVVVAATTVRPAEADSPALAPVVPSVTVTVCWPRAALPGTVKVME